MNRIDTSIWELIGTYNDHKQATQKAFEMTMDGSFMRIQHETPESWSVWMRKEQVQG